MGWETLFGMWIREAMINKAAAVSESPYFYELQRRIGYL